MSTKVVQVPLSAATFVSWPVDPSHWSTAPGGSNEDATSAGHWRCGHADADEDCVLGCPLPKLGHSECERTIRCFDLIRVVQRKRCQLFLEVLALVGEFALTNGAMLRLERGDAPNRDGSGFEEWRDDEWFRCFG